MPAARALSHLYIPNVQRVLWQQFGSFANRLFQRHVWHVPSLPTELHGDVGLGEELPASRLDAFWASRRASASRDLRF
jgi:hypothetical protein